MSVELNRCVLGDCRRTLSELPASIFACCVTSPPYWGLRDYGHPDQLGLERTTEEYVARMVEVFCQVRRVLRDDGTLWLNLGDSYAGSAPNTNSGFNERFGRAPGQRKQEAQSSGMRRKCSTLKPKDLVGIPWRVAFALQADGWYLRSDIIWCKPNPMPESVTDRPTKAHEYVFLLSKCERYYFDADAVAELATTPGRVRCDVTAPKNGFADPDRQRTMPRARERIDRAQRNCRTVWTLPTQPYDGAHFATIPPKLVERCVLAGSSLGGAVLDPFFGSGTVGQVAEQLGRAWLGCELNPEYGKLAAKRTAQSGLRFVEPELEVTP